MTVRLAKRGYGLPRPDLTPDYEVVQRCVRFERSEMVMCGGVYGFACTLPDGNVVIMARTGFPPLFHSSPLSVTVARRLPHGGPNTQRCAKLRVRLTAIPTSDVNFTVEARSR